MKIKKGLALILALVMIITLMPTMAFAKTTNSVVKTYTVATDSDMPVVAIDLRADDSTGISANNVKFRINLENKTIFSQSFHVYSSIQQSRCVGEFL